VTVTLEVDTSNINTPTTNLSEHTLRQVLQGHQRAKVFELQLINMHENILYDGSFYLTPGNILAVHQANTVY
jgi:hypothetical protein